jgi:hypothetical protein
MSHSNLSLSNVNMSLSNMSLSNLGTPPPSAGGLWTPPGTADLMSGLNSRMEMMEMESGMMSPGGGAGEARRAVYIVDGEEVSRRLGMLLSGGVEGVESSGDGGVEERGDGDGDVGDEREEDMDMEGEREQVLGEREERETQREKQREREMADPVLPLTDYFAPGRVLSGEVDVKVGKNEGMHEGEMRAGEPELVPTVPNTPLSISRNASAGGLQVRYICFSLPPYPLSLSDY